METEANPNVVTGQEAAKLIKAKLNDILDPKTQKKEQKQTFFDNALKGNKLKDEKI